MKLCLIYHYAPHYRTDIFKLMDRNLDIDFVFGDQYLNIKKMDYTLLHNNVTEVKNKWFGAIGWQKGVVKLAFKKYDVYIIIGGPMVISTWLILILSRLQRKRVYFWTHGWYGKETKIKSLIKKTFFSLANGNLLYGNYARELMIKEGMNPDKLHVIYNSLAYDKQIEIRGSLNKNNVFSDHFDNNNPNVVFVGRLTKVKQLYLLIEALSISKQNKFEYNVTFIGDGEEKDTLQNLTINKGLSSQVWFYGSTYDEEELSNLLYNADLCVAPGNIGLTAMHAMVYGCPCISHNDFTRQMPEFEAIREDVTGSFFEYNNSESLSDSIIHWFTRHYNDRILIRKACFDEIDEKWNPHIQLEIIKETINKA